MTNSKKLFETAQQYLPGGVSSPVRAFQGVGGNPLFIQSGKGAYIRDVDDREYIDYVCSWGPLIHGHAHPYVLERLNAAMQKGLSFGAPTEIEVQLAAQISKWMPSMQMLRFVNSGTEAVMSAIRVARAYTRRDKILKFSGCYHGHSDSVLVSAGSGLLTFGHPSSKGVPSADAQHTAVAEYNRIEQVEEIFENYGDEIAAVIVEPVAGNMNLVLPQQDFLERLRSLCSLYDSVLIFDEVITGFRVGIGGAQTLFGVRPDLTILGKIIGGGLPAAAFGGEATMMRLLAPLGPVYQAGTLSGNPLAMTAGMATLELLAEPQFYKNLSAATERLAKGLMQRAGRYSISLQAPFIGGMFGLFFMRNGEERLIETEEDVKKCDIDMFKRFFHGMLEQGVYLAPSAYEIGFVSAAHGEEEIAKTLTAAERVFQALHTKKV
jgi:glutamate-1-semialdehyde 2,1-aminomutase